MPKLREHPGRFREYFRMPIEQFDLLFQQVHNSMLKNSNRPSLCPEERLVITLRFLATGETFRSLAYRFRVGRQTVHSVVRETCKIVYDTLAATYLRVPQTQEEWLRVANDFQHLPHALGCGRTFMMRPFPMDPHPTLLSTGSTGYAAATCVTERQTMRTEFRTFL